jgi:zinc finger protein
LSIPEIDLELHAGTLGGRFTTLEGILDQIYEELSEKVFSDESIARSDTKNRQEFESFLLKLKEVSAAALLFKRYTLNVPRSKVWNGHSH